MHKKCRKTAQTAGLAQAIAILAEGFAALVPQLQFGMSDSVFEPKGYVGDIALKQIEYYHAHLHQLIDAQFKVQLCPPDEKTACKPEYYGWAWYFNEAFDAFRKTPLHQDFMQAANAIDSELSSQIVMLKGASTVTALQALRQVYVILALENLRNGNLKNAQKVC